jgi:poly-gamma-glutamate synthesis protein (capsule biosynthesis protein)
MKDIYKYFLLLLFLTVGFSAVIFVSYFYSNSSNEVTEHMSVILQRGRLPLTEDKTTTILVVGDIMLGRYVETLMKRYGTNYPFEKIGQFPWGADLVMGNLEGAIPEFHAQTPLDSVRFNFSPDVAEVLRSNHFNIVTLANNHTFGYGQKGYIETRDYLNRFDIDSTGHPFDINEIYVLTRGINGQVFKFISFNATNPYFDINKAALLVQEVKKKKDFVIINIHWGVEYKSVANKAQQNLAHILIDSGADVVIGHHPHVVENLELYKGKLIFYSLGNFIFDQYFSKATQESLAVSMEISGSAIIYRLLPIESTVSQPTLMEQQEKKREWLKNLSSISSSELTKQIQKGVISLRR